MGSVGGAVRRVVDGMTSELKVYFYACYDEADKQAYSGLTIGLCAASVRESTSVIRSTSVFTACRSWRWLWMETEGSTSFHRKKPRRGRGADEHQERLSAFMFSYSLTQKRGIGNGLPSLRGLRRIP